MHTMPVDPFVHYEVSHFFHFCDRRNLPLIRELGGLYSLQRLEEMSIQIPAPGGNTWSHDAALLHESSLARTMPIDRILTGRYDMTLASRVLSSD